MNRYSEREIKLQGLISQLELQLAKSKACGKFTLVDALRIRSEASNWMLGDDEYLRILNKEVKL
tara:strand:- start:637 stop:828 length:192 start_codon:yes stop_codon:yes gene_type:complete